MQVQLLVHIIKKLVDAPEQVAVTRLDADGQRETFQVAVSTQDRGKVIGREGQTIRALRLLCAALSLTDKPIELVLAE
jgi:predicted RNA-binding protein YlqC (UPF0109 family)